MRTRRIGRVGWLLAVVMAAIMMAAPSETYAQRRGGSRSRSSTRSAPRAKSAPKAKARPKAAKPARGQKKVGKASAKKGDWGSSKKKAGKSKKATRADAKAYEKAKASGKAFKDRKGAMNKFSSDPANQKKYTSKYASKPATRPGHIPQTYSSGGNTYNISYNQAHGGYGHMDAVGTFILYNSMADMAMRPYYDRQMAMAGYHVGPPVVYRSSIGTWIIALVVIVAAVMVVSALARRGDVTSVE